VEHHPHPTKTGLPQPRRVPRPNPRYRVTFNSTSSFRGPLQQAVGVLVRAALSGARAVTEVHRDKRLPREILMASHLGALIPSQGTAQMGRERSHRFCQPVAQTLSTGVPARCTRNALVKSADHFCGPVPDHDHVREAPGPVLLPAARPATGPSAAEGDSRVHGQIQASAPVQGLINGLRRVRVLSAFLVSSSLSWKSP
jgi:hypothetical protein